MTAQAYKTHEDLLVELEQNREFQRAFRQQEPYYAVAREVLNHRNELGLTQKELAERAQTYQSRISKIESAELDVRLSTLIEIAEALYTRVDIRLVKVDEFDERVYQALFRTSATAAPCAQPCGFTATIKSDMVFA